MKRTASAQWRGDLKTGKGTVSTASGVLSNSAYSFHTRFEDGKGTNPEELLAAAHAALFAEIARHPRATVKVDLPNQTLTLPDGQTIGFPVDSFSKHCLVQGIDELGYILQQEAAIEEYESRHAAFIKVD